MIATQYNFLTDLEHNAIMQFIHRLNTQDIWETSTSKNPRIFTIDTLARTDHGFGSEADIELLNLLVDIRFKIKTYFKNLRGGLPEIHAESLLLVRWLPGDEQMPHSDCETFSPEDKHPYPWRTHASLVYLNDDFDGGELYFPQHHLEIKPKPKNLVVFTGNNSYLHGVYKVENGIRYTLASFWTEDQSKRDGLPS